ncbi:MAG: SDR family oxidoreductase [Thalassobaculales bacterium]
MTQKSVLITGATAGFGAATARRFAAAGWRLVLAGRRAERLEALKAELAGVPVHTIALDVRDRAAVQAAFAGLPAEFAALDVLVNNAGLALGTEPADKVPLDDWEQMVDTNIKGLMYCSHAAIPGMVARKSGHIVNLGSIAGTYPYPGGNVYGGTKAFVHQFSLNLRADLVQHGVRVTSVEPGLAESEFSIVRYHGDVAKAKAVYAGTQPIRPEDVAEVVFFCVSMPPNVNINVIELMAGCQAFNGFNIVRS